MLVYSFLFVVVNTATHHPCPVEMEGKGSIRSEANDTDESRIVHRQTDTHTPSDDNRAGLSISAKFAETLPYQISAGRGPPDLSVVHRERFRNSVRGGP